MSQQLFLPNIKGLIPLIDRRKASEPYIVEGQNFIMDADGPLSGLGRTVVSHKAISILGNIQTFKIAETLESFIANNEGIFRFDTESGETILLYKFSVPVTSEFPWSMAAVGNKYYFAREDSDLIEYDIVNDVWTTLTGGSIPSNIYACTESDGRLILLTNIWIAWSSIGDGTNFTASVVTGAGAQALTKLGLSNPKPLGVKTVADGFLTFLSSGIMRSHALIASIPYRHTILSKQHRIVNPYCLTNDEDDNVIFLSKTGLYKTQGEKPQAWQPAMGEYFHTSVIPNLDVINNQNNLQIDFDYERSWFSIWIAESQSDYQYTKAFLLNTKINQWGVLTTPFIALANFYTLPTTFEGFIYGLIDNEGSVLRFDGTNGVEQVPLLVDGYSYYHTWEEIPARNVDDLITFTVHGAFSTTSKLNYANTGTYYKFNYVQSLISPADLSAESKDTVQATEVRIFEEEWVSLSTTDWTLGIGSPTVTFPLTGIDSSPSISIENEGSYTHNDWIPFSETALYKIEFRIRMVKFPTSPGRSLAVLGCEFEGTLGLTSTQSICAFENLNIFNLNTWVVFKGYFQGSNESPAAPRSSDVNNPVEVDSSFVAGGSLVENFRAYLRVNTDTAISGDGITEIDYITIEEVIEERLIFKTNTTFAAGLTELKETKQDPNLNSLNSFVTIGPLRVFNEQDSDRYSYINNLTIGTLEGSVGDTFDDWANENLYPVDLIEDWLTATGDEDWGFNTTSTVDYNVEMVCTLDAVKSLAGYIPSITKINSLSASDYYTCETSGIYHLIKIKALESGQNYHIKTIDLAAELGGRL